MKKKPHKKASKAAPVKQGRAARPTVKKVSRSKTVSVRASGQKPSTPRARKRPGGGSAFKASWISNVEITVKRKEPANGGFYYYLVVSANVTLSSTDSLSWLKGQILDNPAGDMFPVSASSPPATQKYATGELEHYGEPGEIVTATVTGELTRMVPDEEGPVSKMLP